MTMILTKDCSACGEGKPLDSFALQGYRKKDGTRSPRARCKACVKQSDDVFRRATNHRAANVARYGITVAQYEEMYEDQFGLCAGCAEPRDVLFIDHKHACCPSRTQGCGRCVRGLLCSPCNFTVGHARDSPSRLRQLAAYLEDAPA